MKESRVAFYAKYNFINATSTDDYYKDKIYPIILLSVEIKISKPRKPSSVLRKVQKSRKQENLFGSFDAIMKEVGNISDTSTFRLYLPPTLKKEAEKAEKTGKKVVILMPPNEQKVPVLLGVDTIYYLNSKKDKS